MGYNINRVLEPQQVLPTSAWRLDNNRNIYPDELRISIKRIHLEGTSFNQIRTEANENQEKIKQKIIDIVIRRGKLHNPVTDTGGLAFGVIDQIGAEFDNSQGFRVGDEILCNASLASLPMYIEKIHSIDPVFHQIDADGYIIVNSKITLVKVPEGIPENLLMCAFDESGTLYRIHQIAQGMHRILIVGNSLITNILYGYVLRRAAGKDAEIVCIFDKKGDLEFSGGKVDELMSQIFDEVHHMDILKPLECMQKLDRDSYFELSVNCAEVPGAETINILAATCGGTVVFTNLINNLNIALYITESMAKPLEVRGAEGYVDGYDAFDVQVVGELAPYFENASFSLVRTLDNLDDAPPAAGNPAFARGEEVAMLEDYVYRSRAMNQVLDEIMRVSRYDCNVLIFGDTGVGKEKAANIIQKNSDRKMQPFVKINCASISPNLIESEFFGYEKGAFTGASASGKKGYFEIANNGVIFLDEIGELPLEMQAKLLRAIQDGEFFRVGGTVPIKTNVRIISATNRNLEEFIEKGLFRRDLYYRLNVVPIRIPRLEERPEDIPALVGHFLKKYGKKFGRRRGIDDAAMDYLKQQQWPGNIRELENTVQRLIISAAGDNISLMDVMRDSHGELFSGSVLQMPGELQEEETEVLPEKELDLQLAVDEYEKGLIRYACDKYGSTRKAARALGISQTQIVRKKKKYDI
ncbi:MAG: sigma 54-interacting transcriptional regulator [Firmicutes bacterium]|nr:sigma 54-interacting transcriptional regulator [Bacillota bacterium]MDD7602882.1 sigma 54-interacting transcriptional regulator [Bacillota bacterium]MDY5856540.1 sigma 54-interacting transcriptional regulator [Anaerovoracaceae bacterium]